MIVTGLISKFVSVAIFWSSSSSRRIRMSQHASAHETSNCHRSCPLGRVAEVGRAEPDDDRLRSTPQETDALLQSGR
jgi:hypothetical protein